MEADPLLSPNAVISPRPRSGRLSIPKAPRGLFAGIKGQLTWVRHKNYQSIACVYAIFSCFYFATAVLRVPCIELLQRAICRRHYGLIGSDALRLNAAAGEEDCKAAPVQNELAFLFGLDQSIASVPGFLLNPFFCDLADKIGRKPVLALAWGGEILYFVWYFVAAYFYNVFPPTVVLVSGLFLFIGGGGRVVISVLLAMLTDTAPESYTVAFLSWHGTTFAVMGLVAPVVASSLMGVSLAAPFLLSMSVGLIGCGIIALAHETLPSAETATDEQVASLRPDNSPALSAQAVPDATSAMGAGYQAIASPNNVSTPSIGLYHSYRRAFGDSWRELGSWNLIVCFVAFFLKRVSFASEGFVYQYASKYLDVDLKDTTWLQMTNALGAALATGVALPAINSFLSKKNPSDGSRLMPLWGARISALILVAGNLIMGFSQRLTMFALGFTVAGLGECLEPSLQSLVRSFVQAGAAARMFGLIAVVDTCAFFVSGPLMAALFLLGQRVGGLGSALIFFISQVLFSIVFGLTFLLRRYNSE